MFLFTPFTSVRPLGYLGHPSPQKKTFIYMGFWWVNFYYVDFVYISQVVFGVTFILAF